jgi:hypothetical protein
MRDDPYPARFYGRQIDEPYFSQFAVSLSADHTDASRLALHQPLHQPLHRVLLLLMTIYLGGALFLIFAVSSYAAPLESATISAPSAVGCDGWGEDLGHYDNAIATR